MKSININGTEKAMEALTAALTEAQGRATARTLTAKDVVEILEDATKKMNISKKSMKGVKAHYTGAEQFPAAYKYSPDSTNFLAEHNGKNWIVKDIFRGYCPNRKTGKLDVTLTDEARAAIIAKYERM